jgi:WD40 repeat protein
MTEGDPFLFVSYAHQDRELCRRLVVLLRLALRSRGYDVWWDQAMLAGPWRDQIDDALRRAVAGVVLISEHALASLYVMEQELPVLLQRGPVAPIYGGPCSWRDVEVLAALQFLGSSERALVELDEATGELTAALSALARRTPLFLRLFPAADAEHWDTDPDDLAEGGASLDTRGTPGALHEVPELPGGYFERTADLDQLRSRLLAAETRTVGVVGRGAFGMHGAGGIGKTVFAAALARDPVVRRAFPDGVHWVTLGEHADPVQAQRTLARQLGLDGDFRTAEGGQEALRERLLGHRVLLVVDDAWAAADAEAMLVTDSPGRIMVTTRHPLVLARLRADQAVVDRLGPDDARRFLARATGDERLPAEADELIEEVGGLVLALALLAAAIEHGTPWGEALMRLRRAAQVFRDESFADQFRAMQVAWDALDDPVRDRYRDFAVFGEDVRVPLDTVALLWQHTAGLGRDAAVELCAQLAARRLLQLDGDPPAVRFHDMQRSFLQLRTADSALAHRQLLQAHAGVPVRAGQWSTMPVDEPYMWEHLVEHLVAAGDVLELERILLDTAWLLHRLHLHGVHAAETDLASGLDALPGFQQGARLLHRLRQTGHLVTAVPRLADRALTLTHQLEDLVPVDALDGYLSPVTLVPHRPADGSADALDRVIVGHLGGVRSVAWSPDHRRVATAGLDGTLRIWNTDAAGRQAAALGGHGPLRSVAWSPDGSHVAAAGDDGVPRVWPAVPGAAPMELPGHDGAVWSVAWSPDGSRLASAGTDGTLRVWDPTAGSPAIDVRRGHDGTVWSVAWSPDGARLASGGADRTLRTWAVDDPSGAPELVGEHPGWVSALTWSPDGTRLATGGGHAVLVWTAAPGPAAATPGRPTLRLPVPGGLVWGIDWAPDGRRVAACGNDLLVRVWDLEQPAQPAVLAGHEDQIWAVAWSPDGTRLATAAHDETVRVWVPSRQPGRPGVATGSGRWVWALAWSPDGRWLATGSETGAIRLWTPASPNPFVRTLAELDSGVWALHWSPDGTRLVAAGADRIIRIWDTDEPDPREWPEPVTLTGHDGLIRAVVWAPDGERLATTADDATVRVWWPDGTHRELAADRDRVRARALAWSPAGDRLVTGHDDGALRVWAADTPDQVPVARAGHDGRVESVAWSPDGRWVASGGLDGAVLLWSPHDPASPPVPLVRHGAPVTAVRWSPDGAVLASGAEDRTVRLTDPAGEPVTALGINGMVCSLAWHDRLIAVGTAASWTVLRMEQTR